MQVNCPLQPKMQVVSQLGDFATRFYAEVQKYAEKVHQHLAPLQRMQ